MLDEFMSVACISMFDPLYDIPFEWIFIQMKLQHIYLSTLSIENYGTESKGIIEGIISVELLEPVKRIFLKHSGIVEIKRTFRNSMKPLELVEI